VQTNDAHAKLIGDRPGGKLRTAPNVFWNGSFILEGIGDKRPACISVHGFRHARQRFSEQKIYSTPPTLTVVTHHVLAFTKHFGMCEAPFSSNVHHISVSSVCSKKFVTIDIYELLRKIWNSTQNFTTMHPKMVSISKVLYEIQYNNYFMHKIHEKALQVSALSQTRMRVEPEKTCTCAFYCAPSEKFRAVDFRCTSQKTRYSCADSTEEVDLLGRGPCICGFFEKPWMNAWFAF